MVIKKYVGETFNPDGSAEIAYTEIKATAQMQPYPSYKLAHLQGFTSGGVFKVFYFNEDLNGVTAPVGNDLILVGVDEEGNAAETYKVIEQSEGWYATSGWSKVLAQRQ